MGHRHWNICSGSAGAGTMVGSDMSSDAGTENGAGTTVNFVCFYQMNALSKKSKHQQNIARGENNLLDIRMNPLENVQVILDIIGK